MPPQFLQHIRTHGRVVHDAQEGGTQLNIGNVLHHVPGHTAVDVLYPSGVAPTGDVAVIGESLDIYEYGTDDNDTHNLASCFLSLFLF